MAETGCLKDGCFQNLQVDGAVGGYITLRSGKIISGLKVGTIADGAAPTITAALMLDHDILNYASGTNVTDAVWDTGANIDTALTERGVPLFIGLSFDIHINNSDGAVFIWAALSTGITSGSGAATNDNCQLPVAAAGLAPAGHFRFIRTATGAYTVYALGLSAS